MKVKNIAVLGAGSWGATLAVLLSGKKYHVSLWEFYRKQATLLNKSRKLPFLPGLKIPKDINITNDISEAVKDAMIIVFAVPSQTVRNTAKMLLGVKFPENTIIVNVSKGIEIQTSMLISDVLKQELRGKPGNRIVALSGPSHAEEVSRKMSTTIVAASRNPSIARTVQKVFGTPYFRIYTSKDVTGVEIGGSLKNIIAIAAGIGDGMGMGDNAKAALITRGSFEIMKLGKLYGAKNMTFAGLSGIGDLIVTCTSRNSRNRNFGEKIGSGKTIKQSLTEIGMTVEGISTTRAARKIARKHKIQMPITEKLYQVLFQRKNPIKAEKELMNRTLKSEY